MRKKKVVVLYTGLWSPYRPFGNADPSPIHKVDGLMEENYINFIFNIHMFGFHNPFHM
jgi:hypothetical protein